MDRRCFGVYLHERFDVLVPDETHFIPVLWDLYGGGSAPCKNMLTVAQEFFVWNGRQLVQRILDKEALEERDLVAGLDRLVGLDSEVTVREFVDAFFQTLTTHKGAIRWGDKTPDYGFFMRRLLRLWPNARFVHLHRDGCAAAMSMMGVNTFRLMAVSGVHLWHLLGYRKQFSERLDEAQGALSARSLFRVWQRRIERMVDEASRVPADVLLNVRYESLLESPQQTMQEVADFLELTPDAAWMQSVIATVRSDNLDKYATDEAYQALQREFAGTVEVIRGRLTSHGRSI